LKKLIALVIVMTVAGFLTAQTAEEMDRLLAADELSYTQAARFVLRAANVPGGRDAFLMARDLGWLPGRAEADSPIVLGELAHLILKAFKLKGGIMYTVFQNPRYACRALVHAQIIRGRTNPAGRLDGRAFLQILSRVLTHTGEDEALAAEREALIAAEQKALLREDARLRIYRGCSELRARILFSNGLVKKRPFARSSAKSGRKAGMRFSALASINIPNVPVQIIPLSSANRRASLSSTRS
jgi:hypothetical protein